MQVDRYAAGQTVTTSLNGETVKCLVIERPDSLTSGEMFLLKVLNLDDYGLIRRPPATVFAV